MPRAGPGPQVASLAVSVPPCPLQTHRGLSAGAATRLPAVGQCCCAMPSGAGGLSSLRPLCAQLPLWHWKQPGMQQWMQRWCWLRLR